MASEGLDNPAPAGRITRARAMDGPLTFRLAEASQEVLPVIEDLEAPLAIQGGSRNTRGRNERQGGIARPGVTQNNSRVPVPSTSVGLSTRPPGGRLNTAGPSSGMRPPAPASMPCATRAADTCRVAAVKRKYKEEADLGKVEQDLKVARNRTFPLFQQTFGHDPEFGRFCQAFINSLTLKELQLFERGTLPRTAELWELKKVQYQAARL